MVYYVYTLYSNKLRKRYIGYTEDLKLRTKEHNSGRVPFTSRGIPWKLIYYQAFLNKKDANAEERFLKSGQGRERLKFLLKDIMSHL